MSLTRSPLADRLRNVIGSLHTPLSSRALNWFAALILGAHAVLAWIGRQPGVLTQQDDVRYILLARALRSFTYVDLHTLGTPPHHLYPPGYPALLAAWGAVFGESFDAFVAVNILLSVGMLALLYVALRRIWSPRLALWSLTALAVNPFVLEMAGQVRSERLFTFLVIGGLVAAMHAGPRATSLVAAGVAAILAALTRSIGVAVVAALAGHWLLERRFRVSALYAVAVLLTVGAWLWWSFSPAQHHVGASYAADFLSSVGAPSEAPSRAAVLLGRMADNIPGYFALVLPYQMPLPVVPGTLIDNALHVLILLPALVAGAVVLYRTWRPAALFLLLYGAVLVIWPWNSARFLVPLLPLIVPTWLRGVEWLAARFAAGWEASAVRIAALVLVGWGSIGSWQAIAALTDCDRDARPPQGACVTVDQASYFAAVRHVAELPQDAVLLSMKPEPLYYFTQRRSVSRETAMSVDSLSFLPFLRDAGVEYVLASSLQQWETWLLPRRLHGVCEHLTVEAAFPPRTYLFRLHSPSEPPPTENACHATAHYRYLNTGRRFQ